MSKTIIGPSQALHEIFVNSIGDEMLQLRGEVSLQVHDKNGRLVQEVDLGKNVICTRARMVLSRMMAQNLKQFSTSAVGSFHPDWATFFGKDFLINGATDPGSFAYPFAPGDVATFPNVLQAMAVFGGVPTNGVEDWTNPSPVPTIAGQNQTPGGSAFHHGGTPTDTSLLYALGITGMTFGNGGHLFNDDEVADPTVGPNPADTKGYIMNNYNSAISTDVSHLPAEPFDPLGAAHGYAWPGGGNKATYPNLHQPNTFSYEPVFNGVVPWGYAGLAGITDNEVSGPGNTRCVYEGNSTLFSETMRLPLDKDGIEYIGTAVRFKVTVPADSELNQIRNFGYARRPRNWMTEAGLITGENILIQSPDPITTTTDPTPTGVSNLRGAQLVEDGFVLGGAGLNAGFYSSCRALPKDYFSRFRNPETGEYFVDSYGQINSDHNNVWNITARKVFGLITKSPDLSYSFLWTVHFG